MIKRLFVIVFVGVIGVAVGSLVPAVSQAVRVAFKAVPLPPAISQAAHAVMQTGDGSGKREGDGHDSGSKKADAHGSGEKEG